MTKYLVDGPQATDFLDLSHTESGLRAMLGDPKAHDPMVGPDITNAQIALREAAKKIAALVNDPTRTDVEKHGAAKKLATETADRLTKTKAALEQRSGALYKDATAKADLQFGPKAERAGLHSEIRGWVRETLSKGGDGVVRLRAAIKTDKDLASVVYHSPRFLLGGLPEDVHSELRFEAMEVHEPELYANLSRSVNLTKLAAKYDNAIRKVQTNFYNPNLAGQAAKRVAI